MTSVMEAPPVSTPSDNKPESKGIVGLNPADIAILMGKAKQRNAYGPKLLEFALSDEAAINPAEVWPIEFGKKEPSTLYQGFMNAVKKAKMQDDILVKQSDGNVFILHKERINIVMAQLADEAAEGDDDDNEETETVSE